MPNSEPSIQCSNPHCQVFNDLKSRFCQRCKTPVVKRYLWAIGETPSSEEKIDFEPTQKATKNSEPIINELATKEVLLEEEVGQICDRYIAISDRIFLDTQPGATPQIPEQLSPQIVNYLQLFAYFPHVPQVYGQLEGTKNWLVDYGTVPMNQEGELTFADLLPKMTLLWKETTSGRQLNWLRQIAGLWKPLSEKGMSSTLINPDLIRVNGSLIQLIELQVDGAKTPTLEDLGRLWKQWSQQANATIKDALLELSQRMEAGSVKQIEQIEAILDRTLDFCLGSHEYSYEIFAYSDSGPKRSNNQDTAYPYSKIPLKNNLEQQSLAIVCDGVGGHEGGEIASQETVDYLCDRVSAMSWHEQYSVPANVIAQLVQFTNEANDAISKRNDSEQRQDRQRMGTTLVMSLARNHEVYLTHVGDSRIYLITNNSCHQVTIDDDLASREVRLGYAVYRNALKYPSAGALIQALGMRNSAALHPNVQRLVIDDDCLLLLCSDGLSDFDRVEQYWRDVIVPVLEDQLDLTKAVKTLIKIGNERNGHDNVTAALVHCQVKPKPEVAEAVITWNQIEASLADSVLRTENSQKDAPVKTESISAVLEASTTNSETANNKKQSYRSSTKSKSSFVLLIVAIGSIFAISLGILIYAYNRDQNDAPNSPQSNILLTPDS